MGITKLKVSNFKSFDELEIELRPLNIVVGANAAGKSNFMEIFGFLRSLAESGLENAVSLQGGTGFLANLNIGHSRPISFQVSSSFPEQRSLLPLGRFGSDVEWATPLTAVYDLELGMNEARQRLECRHEKVQWEVELNGRTPATRAHIEVWREAGQNEPWVSIQEEAGSAPQVDLLEWNLGLASLGDSETLLGQSRLPWPEGIRIYDFDPKLSKETTSFKGRSQLDPNGRNLAIVLRSILEDPRQSGRLSLLLKDILRFVEGLRVESLADQSLLLSLKEVFSGSAFLPAPFLSNGTIHVIELILALYFERAEITIIEEPERNIHPHLISKIAAMMKDASRERQILVTTHNPELVKHADLADLLLVSRDAEGFSRISRPAESTELKVFLENELGIDELYVQDLLGAGHAV